MCCEYISPRECVVRVAVSECQAAIQDDIHVRPSLHDDIT